MRRALLLAAGLAGAATLAACGGGATSAGAGGAPAPADGPEATTKGEGRAVNYRLQPSTGYALTRNDSIVIQLPAGGAQTQRFERTMFFTVAQQEAPDGFGTTIVLDSLRTPEPSMVPADSLRAAEGTRWTALMKSSGELTNLTPDRTTGVGAQIGGMLHLLFPTLPEGGARSGAAWSDTTERTVKANAFDATEKANVSYRAAGDTSLAGRRALRIESDADYQQSGTGSQFGQQMEMNGSGRRHMSYAFADGGFLAGATGRDSAAMTITVPAVGQSVSVQQLSQFTITTSGRPPR